MTENIIEQNVYYKKKDMDFAFKKMTEKQKIHVILVICIPLCDKLHSKYF
jgi:ACT domain-containing protein